MYETSEPAFPRPEGEASAIERLPVVSFVMRAIGEYQHNRQRNKVAGMLEEVFSAHDVVSRPSPSRTIRSKGKLAL